MIVYPSTNCQKTTITKQTISAGVYFIGAGPGDPQLLTIKAGKIIKEANIIIYAGSLVNKKILKFGRKSALIYDSSKMSLEGVLKIIKKAKSQN